MFFSIIVLALVQGLTEFLPVSSSGHLVLLNRFFGIENDFLLLSVVLHVATLVSVIIVLRKEIWFLIRNPFSSVGKRIIFATIPTVLIVIIFKRFIDSAFNGAYLPICFMVTAFAIVLSEFLNKRRTISSKDISVKDALLMGVAQGIAVLPGISRSGATICTGLALGNNREKVAHFSFLMSVPIIIASLIMEVYEYISVGQTLTIPFLYIMIGFIIALVTGIFAIKFMLNIVKKHSMIGFAIYLSILSFVTLFLF